ncbi:MAG: hypothetical protein FJY29_12135 [Betaproteobacteria bacterium]|nr:hypothetical protein [Betaproteobacteria bacterium]
MSPTLAQTTPAMHAKQACAFVLHGLNTNPERMGELAALIEQQKFQTTVGQLAGHTNTAADDKSISAIHWKSEFIEQWNRATEKCRGKNDERLFVGYSLGALAGMNVFDSQTQLPLPTQMILLSPALSFRYKVLVIRSIAWLPFGSLPSLNHPDYRARNTTPLKSYNSLFDLHDEWRTASWNTTASIPTTVVLSEKDELVDSQTLAKTIVNKSLSLWKVLWLSNDDATLTPRYYHLMIDQRSMGTVAWNILKDSLEKSISLSPQENPQNGR